MISVARVTILRLDRILNNFAASCHVNADVRVKKGTVGDHPPLCLLALYLFYQRCKKELTKARWPNAFRRLSFCQIGYAMRAVSCMLGTIAGDPLSVQLTCAIYVGAVMNVTHVTFHTCVQRSDAHEHRYPSTKRKIRVIEIRSRDTVTGRELLNLVGTNSSRC